VEIVRGCLSSSDGEWKNALGFDGDDIVLILEYALDHQEALGDEENPIFLNKIGMHDGIGDAGFVFNAEEYESLGGAGALARDDATADSQALSAAKRFEF